MPHKPISLDDICKHCDRSVRAHCTVRGCLYFFRFCATWLVDGTDDWHELPHFGGSCLTCSHPIPWHYTFQRMTLRVLGEELQQESKIVLMFPTWSGCPVDAPSVLERFGFEDMQEGSESYFGESET